MGNISIFPIPTGQQVDSIESHLSTKIESKLKEKGEALKDAVMDVQFKQADQMRQAQVAMSMAMAREQLLWGTGLYSLLVSGAVAETIKNRGVFPKMMAPPLVIGGFVLSWLADVAYGNKMARVRHEAEFIQRAERDRLVPPSTLPMRKWWQEDEYTASVGRVSDKWPFSWRRVKGE